MGGLLAPPAAEPDTRGVPVPGACLLCGVGTVRMAAAAVARRGGREVAAREVWHPVTVAPVSLGGAASAERVAGHTCPACSDAVAAVGSVGATAMERALKVHFRATGQDALADALRTADDVAGLVGWGAVAHAAQRRGRAAVAANARPWEHVDLTA